MVGDGNNSNTVYFEKSDIYSLGILAYEMCAGHLPFESGLTKEKMFEQLAEKSHNFSKFELFSS